MQIITDTAPLRHFLADCQRKERSVGLVPTMGNLHAGHIRLVEEAKARCDVVVTTIFVNPMQFGANEDLGRYPHTPAEDQAKLVNAGCDVLFMPHASVIYPQGLETQTTVHVPDLSERHCGASRPGHFDGVTTIVSKLFNLIPANLAFFGKKDFQQLQLIRKLTADLCFPHKIIGIATVRENDGLALSSRNNYLSSEERQKAPRLHAALLETVDQISKGDRSYRELEERMKQKLENSLIKVDYLNICQADTLLPAQSDDTDLVVLAAVFIGNTRLIDNKQLLLA